MDSESVQSKFIKRLLSTSSYKVDNLKKLRSRDVKNPKERLIRGCNINNEIINGVNCSILTPNCGLKTDKVIIYLHGGVYFCGPTINQWRMISKVCLDKGIKIICVDYRLAPEHKFPAPLLDVTAVYENISTFLDTNKICLLGDSAGGGLCLALILKLKKDNKKLPYSCILLSPWLDVTMSNEEIGEVQPFDYMLQWDDIIKAGKIYADGYDTKHPYISPIYGDLSDLPRTLLIIGTHDILYPDTKKFKKIVEQNNNDLTYLKWDRMVHDFMLFTPMPEADEAIKKIVEFI